LSTTNIYIGTDYKGTLTGVSFNSIPGDNTVTGVWELLDNCGETISTGSIAFVSTGTYTFTIDYASFDNQRPVNPGSNKLGSLIVRLTAGTVDVSVGSIIKFMYPPLIAA